jgi:putative transposase
VIDEYSREWLAIEVGRKLTSHDVLRVLADLFILRGTPAHIRSHNGPEFTAALVRRGLNRLDVQTLFIEPGSPWENGHNESFNGKLRDELLNLEVSASVWEVKVLVEERRREYNQVRPHSFLGYRPPAPETVRPASSVRSFMRLGVVQQLGAGRRRFRHCHGVCKGGAFGASTRRASAWDGSYARR